MTDEPLRYRDVSIAGIYPDTAVELAEHPLSDEVPVSPERTATVIPLYADAVAIARTQACYFCGSRDQAAFDPTVCARCFAGRPERSLLKFPEYYGYTVSDREAFNA